MPPQAPGSLGEEMTLNVLAYILQRMGGGAGNAGPHDQDDEDGQRRRLGRGSGPPSMALGAGTGSGQGRGGAPRLRGVTVRGEVKNYVPVTPEMLKNPPPGDWLIFRRNYHGWSYSPLDQITRDNVHELKLAWVWAMNDSGANQTTPIVHNGVMYLASPATSSRRSTQRPATSSGKRASVRIRRRATAASAASRSRRTRSFCRTSNAHMVALSARTGDILWDTPLSDVNHPSTSGAIVINNNVLQGITGCGRNTSGRRVLHQRDRHQHGKARVAVPHDSARRRAGFDTWGKLPKEAARGRRDVDRRLVRSRPEPHVLGNRAVEAVVVPQSRDDALGQDALLRTRRWR